MPQFSRPSRRAALVGLLAAAAAPVAAARARAEDGEAAAGIRRTISRQIEAFRADDWPRAFSFASPGIRGVFGTPENFGRMVRQGYPMVWRPQAFVFGDLEPRGERLRQTVILTDAEGRTHVADYFMVRSEGAWRIDGVRIRPRQGTGV